jgi:hypothetical protein
VFKRLVKTAGTLLAGLGLSVSFAVVGADAAPKKPFSGNTSELCTLKGVSADVSNNVEERQTPKTQAYLKKVINNLDDDQCIIVRVKTGKYKGYLTAFSDDNVRPSNETEKNFHRYRTGLSNPERLRVSTGNIEE